MRRKYNTQVSPLHYIGKKNIINYFINVTGYVERISSFFAVFILWIIFTERTRVIIYYYIFILANNIEFQFCDQECWRCAKISIAIELYEFSCRSRVIDTWLATLLDPTKRLNTRVLWRLRWWQMRNSFQISYRNRARSMNEVVNCDTACVLSQQLLLLPPRDTLLWLIRHMWINNNSVMNNNNSINYVEHDSR